MLPKANRLKNKKDIGRLLKKGRSFKENFLILKLVKSDFNFPRIAFVVSQKVSKKAALRNKIRRRLSELFRFKIKKIKKGVDLILIAVPGLEEKDFWEIDETMNSLFKKAKCFKE